ncbi:type II toxin-antitoxin system prevent-host-death family antitoxin [Microbacterium sp.]|uniref:type II toxin-antitoxin system Phd/YefM family antitoxin n=1 Tax=Microbacterium sp. TaxID=51671 RepID=UPI0025E56D87|nr:type II toxin-antitoxin system prevent-host-death family antitoxin [Microbacterium sp.]
MDVATIGIRDLRNGLSRHLADVREGTEITVTDHGTPIARIIPIGRESGLEKLIRAGLVTMPTGPRHPLPEPIKTSGTVSDLIADQRR